MNPNLKLIQDLLQQNESLTQQQRDTLLKAIADADKQWNITEFKLDRTEQVKKTTAILLEETIEELEQKRKAVEAQNRELEIETALERVRAVAMGMMQPDDMLEICKTISRQLALLNVKEIRNVQTAIFYEEKGAYMNYEYYAKHDKTFITETAYTNNEIHQAFADQMLKGNGEFFVTHIKGNEVKDWLAYQKTTNVFIDDYLNTASSLNYYWYSLGPVALGISTYEPLREEETNLFKRFLKVFELSYTRYLDIEKSQAQAREAQIQLALERVRARAMAMQRSDELSEAASLLFQQVQSLGAPSWTAGYCIFDEDKRAITLWMSRPWGDIQPSFRAPLDENPSFIRYLEAHNKGLELYVEEISGKALEDNYQYLLTLPIVGEQLKSIIAEGHSLPTYEVDHCAYFSKGFLLFITYEPVPESHEIFKRFASVFDQTYTRFLDLQKAEAQTRESQIQLALERVRARTMAMHKSFELNDTAELLFDQLKQLGAELQGVAFAICDKNSVMVQKWTSIGVFSVPYNIEPGEERMYEAWKNQAGMYEEVYDGERIKKYYELFMEIPAFKQGIQKFIEEGHPLPTWQKNHAVTFKYGYLLLITTNPFNETQIFLRFAKVFEQTYTRFLDLQKAEAQAREAQIEAALERVRAKVMAMRSSEDLNETIKVFYHQLESLHLTPRRCGVGLLNKENRTAELSTMNTTTDGQSIELIGKLDMTIHPVLEGVYNGWLKQEEYHPVLRGNEIKEYYKILRPQIQFPDYPDDAVQYGYFFFFDDGGVYAWTEKQVEEAELQIYRRFTSVLNLTYKRYQDLKQAEANAKEAVKQAALDRIRADIASMRSVSDLDRITPLIWNELTVLGIPFIRCGVFLMDDAQQLIHTFLSAPDGRAIAAFHMPYDTPGNLGKVLSHWQEKKNYTDHWSENEFMSLADVLVKQGAIANRQEYLASLPHGGFHLHFLPFLQGMLYVGNTTRLDEEAIKLLQSVADAFSTAYARYEDFNKLEAAKKQVDSTLNELQATQKQLIQSEKMASLGELTAGIAHEIQNPLNFVNNFSEVSNELVDEMLLEFLNGNANEALGIAEDLKQNLEKINHHGKRADAIVKGMLQHSRTSSGQKEPTDINALCDEYLRLAYHGLRAKDKSFNAEIKTDFDAGIGNISVIPQDIGRVLLNLFNNAFYAVNERCRVEGERYKPSVSVATQKLYNTLSGDGGIEIIVEDNGNGIPQNIVDKIFQPFFTTKPTGQGTGLGLSLAYDIIKVHGGKIKVEAKEGEGSKFVIQLPVT